MDRKQFLTSMLQAGTAICCCQASLGQGEAGQAGTGAEWIDGLEKRMKEGSRSPAWRRIEFAEGWVQRLLDNMDTMLDPQTRSDLMQACGRACYIQAFGIAPDEKPGPEVLASFVESGKDSGVRREGDFVYFQYDNVNPQGIGIPDGVCLCPFVESGPERLSATYCQCSAGYVKELFGRITGTPVAVEVLESVRSGGKLCRFKVNLHPG
ncbi:MAG TPA: DUF6144 family protein [Thermoanaerobaculaceae bacterium]|nr:DUF6144 family protein [Thermoanaerobaculaceae bacterium]HPS77807.1 DUF6144 family protein [Thermoanaerobaculaceae bacterium]